MAVRHGYGKIAGTDALVFAYDTGDIRNSYKGPPTQNYAHQNVANCSSTSGWDGTSVHTQYGLSRTLGVLKDGRTTFHLTYTPNATAGDCYHTIRLKNTNGTNVGTDGGEVFYLTFEWKSEGANYLVEGSDKWNLSTFYGNGWKTGTHMSAQDFGSVAIGNGWYRRTVKYTAAAVTGQTPLMRFSSGYKRTQGGNYQIWVANIAMTSNHPPLNWLPGQTIRTSTEGLKDLTGDSTINLNTVSFDSNAQMTFDGTDDKAEVANFPHIWDGSVSLEAVVSWNDNSRSIIFGNYNVGANDINFEKLSSGTLRFYWNRGERDVTASAAVTYAGALHHVAFIRDKDSNSFKFYVDGELVQTTTNVGTDISSTGSTFRIGADTRNGDTVHNGDIPVLKVYNRALTSAEVKNNFKNYKHRFGI